MKDLSKNILTPDVLERERVHKMGQTSHPEASPDTGRGLSRLTRQAEDDLDGAFSGYGSYCPEGIPVEQAILGILAAFAASFGFLFTAVTMITGRRRRRKRGTVGLDDKAADLYFWGRWDSYFWGLSNRDQLLTFRARAQ